MAGEDTRAGLEVGPVSSETEDALGDPRRGAPVGHLAVGRDELLVLALVRRAAGVGCLQRVDDVLRRSEQGPGRLGLEIDREAPISSRKPSKSGTKKTIGFPVAAKSKIEDA